MLDDVQPEALGAPTIALILCSTTGDGDLPYGADEFWDRISADSSTGTCDVPRADGLRYAVLALGDSTYAYFCEGGVLIDERLAELGAERIAPRTDCDAAYDKPAVEWIKDRVAQLVSMFSEGDDGIAGTETDVSAAPSGNDGSAETNSVLSTAPSGNDGSAGSGAGSADSSVLQQAVIPLGVPEAEPGLIAPARPKRWTAQEPFVARVLRSTRLTDPAVAGCKEVLHLEVDLADSGMVLAPGDSVGVIPLNAPYAVEQFLAAAQAAAAGPLRESWWREQATHDWELRWTGAELMQVVGAQAPGSTLGSAVATGQRDLVDKWSASNCVADALRLLRHRLDPERLVALMRPVRPRAYSVSGLSRTTVDLTVSVDRVEAESMNAGVASGYLADQVRCGSAVKIFPLPNKAFRLPVDPRIPIVMVGAGAGVAPFRAFLEERASLLQTLEAPATAAGSAATGTDPMASTVADPASASADSAAGNVAPPLARHAPGPAWLFAGHRHEHGDFLYREDWLNLQQRRALTRLDTAFSRDHGRKVYVQDVMHRRAEHLAGWFAAGAVLYVCGSESRLAPAVRAAVKDALTDQLGAAAGAELLADMRANGRYMEDVY